MDTLQTLDGVSTHEMERICTTSDLAHPATFMMQILASSQYEKNGGKWRGSLHAGCRSQNPVLLLYYVKTAVDTAHSSPNRAEEGFTCSGRSTLCPRSLPDPSSSQVSERSQCV